MMTNVREYDVSMSEDERRTFDVKCSRRLSSENENENKNKDKRKKMCLTFYDSINVMMMTMITH